MAFKRPIYISKNCAVTSQLSIQRIVRHRCTFRGYSKNLILELQYRLSEILSSQNPYVYSKFSSFVLSRFLNVCKLQTSPITKPFMWQHNFLSKNITFVSYLVQYRRSSDYGTGRVLSKQRGI
jgi:hypothetical protein